MRGISIKYIVYGIAGILLPCILYTLYTIPVSAQSAQNCGGGEIPRAQGLVTAPSLSGKFGTSATGACITDSKVAFAPFKIPTFADLKSTYFDQQSKLPQNTSLPSNFSGDGIYYLSGDLTISSASPFPMGNGTEVIFVNGKLTISQDIKYHSSDALGGVVFVVGGEVWIDSTVTQIDAVIISSSTIYTGIFASSKCQTSDILTSPLVINGSLISLNADSPTIFCRKLVDNQLGAAEIINAQAKYLVVLRDLMSDTLQKWSEIDASVPLPSAGPQATAKPTCINGYKDLDKDGYGSGAFGCYNPSSSYNIVNNGTDCSDTNQNIFQNKLVSKDADNDGISTTTTTSPQCAGTSSTINGRTYYKDTSGNYTWWNSASSVAECTPTADTVPGNCPAAPTGFSAIARTIPNEMYLSWGVVNGATSYKIYRCTTTITYCTPTILVTTVTANTYTDPDLNCTQNYFYTVKANNSAGDSPATNTSGGKPFCGPTTYTLAQGYSSTQGANRWYYYWTPETGGSPSPATYTSSYMQAQAWWGASDNIYWTVPNTWMYVDPDKNNGGDNQVALIYWQAPSHGTAEVTVTEQRIEESGKGNGFTFGLRYVNTVGTWPGNLLGIWNVPGTDLSKYTRQATIQMQGNGDAIAYYKDSLFSTYGDTSSYTITIVFTPN